MTTLQEFYLILSYCFFGSEVTEIYLVSAHCHFRCTCFLARCSALQIFVESFWLFISYNFSISLFIPTFFFSSVLTIFFREKGQPIQFVFTNKEKEVQKSRAINKKTHQRIRIAFTKLKLDCTNMQSFLGSMLRMDKDVLFRNVP